MSDIIGFKACTKELKRLLEEIAGALRAAKGSGETEFDAAMETEARKLVDFTNRTEPRNLLDAVEVDNIRKVDQMATDAMAEIYGESANAIIGRMFGRISQLNQLEKAVRQQAAENEHKARELRLIPVRNAVDAMTDMVDAFKDAKEALVDSAADEAVVKSKVDSLLRAITALEKAVKDL